MTQPMVKVVLEMEYEAPFLACSREEEDPDLQDMRWGTDGGHRRPDEDDIERDIEDVLESRFDGARWRITSLEIDGKKKGSGVWMGAKR